VSATSSALLGLTPAPRSLSGVAYGGTQLDLLRIILAIILPPVGVFFRVGLGGHFWLSILLTLFGYLPGLIHAIWVIGKYSKRD